MPVPAPVAMKEKDMREAEINHAQKPDFMGTRENAEAALVEKWGEWCKYQGAFMDTKKGHREREAMEYEARRRLVDAAATLAWHINFDALSKAQP